MTQLPQVELGVKMTVSVFHIKNDYTSLQIVVCYSCSSKAEIHEKARTSTHLVLRGVLLLLEAVRIFLLSRLT